MCTAWSPCFFLFFSCFETQPVSPLYCFTCRPFWCTKQKNVIKNVLFMYINIAACHVSENYLDAKHVVNYFHFPLFVNLLIFINFPTYLPTYLLSYLPTCLPTYLPTFLPTCLPTCLLNYLDVPTCLPITYLLKIN